MSESRLLLEDPSLLDRVEVTTVNSLAHYVVQEAQGPGACADQ